MLGSPPDNEKFRGGGQYVIIHFVMPDSAEYLQRVQSLVAGDDYIAIQRQTADALSKLIEGVPEGDLQQRPKPDKWSVAEILAHLAQDEIATAWRYRQMIETPGCALAGFDQD